MGTKTRCNDIELSLEDKIKSKMLLQLISAEVEYHFDIKNREHITLEKRQEDFINFVKKNTDASVRQLVDWYGLKRFELEKDELEYVISREIIK